MGNQVKKYHENEIDAEPKVNTEFDDYLIRQFANVTDDNISANTRRGSRLLRSNKLLLAALPLITLSFLCYYANAHGASQNELSSDLNRPMPRELALHCIVDNNIEGPPKGPKPRPVPIPQPTPTRET